MGTACFCPWMVGGSWGKEMGFSGHGNRRTAYGGVWGVQAWARAFERGMDVVGFTAMAAAECRCVCGAHITCSPCVLEHKKKHIFPLVLWASSQAARLSEQSRVTWNACKLVCRVRGSGSGVCIAWLL